MKFLCPKCERLVELRDFKVEGTALVLSCSACGSASRASAPSAPPMALVPPTITGERPALQLTSFPGASNVVALRSSGADAVTAAAERESSAERPERSADRHQTPASDADSERTEVPVH